MFLQAVFILLIAVLTIGIKPAFADGAANAIHIAGDIPKESDWTASQLKAQFTSEITPVHYASHGAQHISNCVPLLSILKAAGIETNLKMDPKADPKTKNRQLRLAIIVEGRDGYAVAFSLAELLPDFGNRAAWLALDVDGNNLAERDGPARLIAPEDAKPGRWVHGVGRVLVVDESGATTSPSGQVKP